MVPTHWSVENSYGFQTQNSVHESENRTYGSPGLAPVIYTLNCWTQNSFQIVPFFALHKMWMVSGNLYWSNMLQPKKIQQQQNFINKKYPIPQYNWNNVIYTGVQKLIHILNIYSFATYLYYLYFINTFCKKNI